MAAPDAVRSLLSRGPLVLSRSKQLRPDAIGIVIMIVSGSEALIRKAWLNVSICRGSSPYRNSYLRHCRIDRQLDTVMQRCRLWKVAG